MLSLLLRVGLPLADLVARSLPTRVAYALADLAGRMWHRLAADRRRVVAGNLARVCVATGRPSSGRSFRKLVEAAFVEHARYWLEVLRAPHYPPERLEEMVLAERWDHWEPVFRSGVVAVVAHLGNFEPFGSFLEVRGLRGIAPVEETEPAELYRFLVARRIVGGRGIRLVPLSQAMRPMLAALRRGEIVALAADRDLAGDGLPVTIFGHRTTLPAGPATLALRTGRPLLVATALRTGRERFTGRAWPVEAERTGDQKADVAALTHAVAARLEAVIAEAPEQWWGAFQPFWADQRQ